MARKSWCERIRRECHMPTVFFVRRNVNTLERLLSMRIYQMCRNARTDPERDSSFFIKKNFKFILDDDCCYEGLILVERMRVFEEKK